MNPHAEVDRCVFCGFCESVCPTYLAVRDRRYGPRGRLYLAKLIFEGRGDGSIFTPLWTCLDCKACEYVCPADIKVTDVIKTSKVLSLKYL